jgi:AcrR family transcriptional regulator
MKTISSRNGSSRARRAQQKEDLRAEILRAAGELFHERGYDGFSLRQVAERIGYTPTTIYLYFRDKDALLLATVQEGFTAFDDCIREVAKSESEPMARLEALGRAYITWGLENPALYQLMFMQRADFALLPRLDDEESVLLEETPGEAAPRSVARQQLVCAVRDAMEAGLIKPASPLVVADVLWSGVHGLVALALSPLMSAEHAAAVTEPLLRALIDGMRAQPATQKATRRKG